jgi:hypothetical protein
MMENPNDDVMNQREDSSGKQSNETPQKSSRSITSSKLFQQAKEATSQAAKTAVAKL